MKLKAVEHIEQIKAHASCIVNECEVLLQLLNASPTNTKKKSAKSNKAIERAEAIAHLTKYLPGIEKFLK